MELHPTTYQVKSRYMKPKSTRKISEASKINNKDGPILVRETRVFGTARNPNIPWKTAPEKPAKGKPASGLLKNAIKHSQTTRSPNPRPPIAETENSADKNRECPKKKSVCFQENKAERNGKFSANGNVTEPQTPMKSPAARAKPRVATPYHSAERCSKCRFDRLETSSYWLSQIKLAESVGKHFVSATFFEMAFECKAEPIRNIRVELKKYLSRHEYVSAEDEWIKLLLSYGLMKDESRANGDGVKAVAEEENASVHNQEDKDLPNQASEENGN